MHYGPLVRFSRSKSSGSAAFPRWTPWIPPTEISLIWGVYCFLFFSLGGCNNLPPVYCFGGVFSFLLVLLVLGDYQTWWELVFLLCGGFFVFFRCFYARFLGVGFAANSGANKLRFVRLACGANFVVVFFTEARRKKKNTSRHFRFRF